MSLRTAGRSWRTFSKGSIKKGHDCQQGVFAGTEIAPAGQQHGATHAVSLCFYVHVLKKQKHLLSSTLTPLSLERSGWVMGVFDKLVLQTTSPCGLSLAKTC